MRGRKRGREKRAKAGKKEREMLCNKIYLQVMNFHGNVGMNIDGYKSFLNHI